MPVLMVSGPYDPVTPPRFAAEVMKQLPHALDLTVPEGHHGPGGLSHSECFAGITARFLERGSADGLDTSCVASMARPPFVTDAAGFAALLQAAGD